MYPVAPGDWLRVDQAYGAQLAEKARLIAADRDRVIAILPGAKRRWWTCCRWCWPNSTKDRIFGSLPVG